MVLLSPQRFYTGLGAEQYLFTVLSNDDQIDFSSATVYLTLGQNGLPGTWQVANTVFTPDGTSCQASILIGTDGLNPAAGLYDVWSRIDFQSQVIIKQSPGAVLIDTLMGSS